MRITDSLFYFNTKNNYQDSMKRLYDANNQISSGSKIQNSYEDSGIYIDTMRLNHEVSTLEQVKKTSSKAQTFANNTDATMNEFTDTLIKFKTKLIQSADTSNSSTSLEAIANDLTVMRTHLQSVANTSIDGQFLFSGTALDVKPINDDGSYSGNSESLNALIGSGVKLPYNIDGNSLFEGSDSDYSKIVSTNVIKYNQTTLSDSGDKVYLKSNDTIQDLVGGDADKNGKPVFYLSGRKPDGSTFNDKFSIKTTSKVSDLIDSIGTSFGNTTTNKVVDVKLNDYGQIEVKDLKKGNSLLDMHIFGAIDRNGAGAVGNADKTDIDDLAAAANVDIIAFDKSSFVNAKDVALDDSATYTRKNFTKDGNDISSNVSQIVKISGEYAAGNTKLLDVAGVPSSSNSLNGKTLYLRLKQIDGTVQNDVQIDLKSSGSTFSLDGGTTNHNIYAADGSKVDADKMTYQQLNDVIAMIVSKNIPNPDTKSKYDDAIADSKDSVDVSLDKKGRINIHDKTNSASKIEFAMFDKNADQFDDNIPPNSSQSSKNPVMSFMANDAVAIQAPHVDFFKELDNMIDAVRGGNFSMDSDFSDPRNLGIENSILKIDHISDHVEKLHTKIGSYSNALDNANQRADFLSLNVKTVRSKIADVDIAEAYMNFTQLSNNYQATLSTISKINSMSLLNYM